MEKEEEEEGKVLLRPMVSRTICPLNIKSLVLRPRNLEDLCRCFELVLFRLLLVVGLAVVLPPPPLVLLVVFLLPPPLLLLLLTPLTTLVFSLPRLSPFKPCCSSITIRNPHPLYLIIFINSLKQMVPFPFSSTILTNACTSLTFFTNPELNNGSVT